MHEPDQNCIFCRIASGVLPADTVAEHERFVAIRDIAPRADTHLLVMPRGHVRDLDEFVERGGSGDEMLGFVGEVAAAEGIAGRYRLITNVGPEAGQVVEHLHWHVMAGERLPGF